MMKKELIGLNNLKRNNMEAINLLKQTTEYEVLQSFRDKVSKLEQEISYSEEEVIELLQKAITHQDNEEIGDLVTAQGKIRMANFYSWFEQFKKK